MLMIVSCSWKQPHCRITPNIVWMASRCSCDLKFESNFRILCNLPAHSVSSLVLTGLCKNLKT
jgi:hypothetical protein